MNKIEKKPRLSMKLLKEVATEFVLATGDDSDRKKYLTLQDYLYLVENRTKSTLIK